MSKAFTLHNNKVENLIKNLEKKYIFPINIQVKILYLLNEFIFFNTFKFFQNCF